MHELCTLFLNPHKSLCTWLSVYMFLSDCYAAIWWLNQNMNMVLTMLVPSTLYFTDTSNWIWSQTRICSLRHTFQLSAHIHPGSPVLLFLFFHKAGLTCHFIRFVFSLLSSLLPLKWLNSLPVFSPTQAVSRLTFIPQKHLGIKKQDIKLLTVTDFWFCCFSWLLWELWEDILFYNDRIMFSLCITNSTFSLTMTNSLESI